MTPDQVWPFVLIGACVVGCIIALGFTFGWWLDRGERAQDRAIAERMAGQDAERRAERAAEERRRAQLTDADVEKRALQTLDKALYESARSPYAYAKGQALAVQAAAYAVAVLRGQVVEAPTDEGEL